MTSGPAKDKQPASALLPLKQRPKLFVLLFVIFALWLGALLTLYFVTVYPSRHRGLPAAAPRPTTSPTSPG